MRNPLRIMRIGMVLSAIGLVYCILALIILSRGGG